MSDQLMSYYEELGLTAAATPDEIRKAHRTLSRLLHPDQQTDEVIRDAADRQMRRLNAMVDILLDPRLRRRYDESLRGVPPPPTIVVHAPPAPPAEPPAFSFSVLRLIQIALAAVSLTLVAIWMIAGDFVHWRGITVLGSDDVSDRRKVIVESFTASNPPVRRAPVEDNNPLRILPVIPESRPPSRADLGRPYLRPRGDMPAETPSVEELLPQTVLPKMALPVPVLNTPFQSSEQNSFPGLWLLPHSSRTEVSKLHQSPEYIQLNIRRREDMVYGEYSARYEVPDRPISPEVVFKFHGLVKGDTAFFPWKASDGSRGGIELKLLSPRTMQVNWHVTDFGSAIGVGGGSAVVIRAAK